MKFFRVRNFERFQHYHDRRPPWIKLYRDLWDDPRFFELKEHERYILIGIFVLASQHENRVSASQSWLQAKLLTSKPIPLQTLIDTGWIEDAEQVASMPEIASTSSDDTLADRYPSRARGETETEIQKNRSTETEKKPQPEKSGDPRQRVFSDFFLSEWQTVRGFKLVTDKADFVALTEMLKKTASDAAYGLAPLQRAASRFIRSQDPFHLKQGHPLRYFASNINAFMGETNGTHQNSGSGGPGKASTVLGKGERPYTPRQ